MIAIRHLVVLSGAKDLRIQRRAVAMPGPSPRCAGSGRPKQPVSAVSASALAIRTGRWNRSARFVRAIRRERARTTRVHIKSYLFNTTASISSMFENDSTSATVEQELQVLAVFALPDRLDQPRQPGIVDVALAPGDLFRAADLQALAILHRLDELRGPQEARRCAGVEPGIAAAELLDGQPALGEIAGVDVGNLELAARRARDGRSDVADVGVIKIESRDRPVGARRPGLLDYVDGAIVGVELHDTIGLRVGDPVGVDRGALPPGAALGQRRQRIAVEEIVAQDQADALAADELFADQEHFGDAAGPGLDGIGDVEAPLPAVAE